MHLMVAFQRLGQGVVDDEAHIRLVDTHAKGNGGSNDLHLVTGPPLLHLFTLVCRQPRMVVTATSSSQLSLEMLLAKESQLGFHMVHQLARAPLQNKEPR